MNIKSNNEPELIALFNEFSSSEFTELRPWQEKILSFWINKTEDKKLISIKIPTGTGKTLVGLVILEYYRQKGKSVLYVANDYFLAKNVLQHCDFLNIPAKILESKAKAKDKIQRKVIHNEYINEKSIVGITVNKNLLLSRDLSYPNILLIDDADNFIPDLRDRFSIKVKREDFPEFWKKIIEKLPKERYDLSSFSLISPEKGLTCELIYFPDFWELIPEFENFFYEKISDGTINPNNEFSELFWQHDNNKEDWKKYLLIISNRDIELSPYVPPSLTKLPFMDLEKLILMSATLNQASLINWEFGVNFTERLVIEEEDFTLDELNTGARVIYPVSDVEKPIDVIDRIVEEFERVIFITPSHKKADRLIEKIKSFFPSKEIIKYSKEVVGLIDKFNKKKDGYLVIAGRYFGLDLASNFPQVLVITNVPFILYNIDDIQRSKFKNDYIFFDRISRRLVQVLGRCNRSEDDQTACIILDSSFFNDYTSDRQLLTNSSYIVKSEVELGFQYAEKTCLIEDVINSVQEFQKKKYNYFKDRDSLIKGLKSSRFDANTLGIIEEVIAWNRLINDDFVSAQKMFTEGANQIKKAKEMNENYANRIALNYYLAGAAAYYNYQLGGEDASHEICKSLLIRSRESSELPWFKRLQLLPILPKEKEIRTEEIEKLTKQLQSWSNDPKTFFGEKIWESTYFDETRDDFKNIFKILLDSDIPEAFGSRIHVIFERVLQGIVEENTTIEKENPGIFDCLEELKSNLLITKETMKEGTMYKDNPNLLRNLNLHRGVDDKSFAKALETFMSWKKLIGLILDDLSIYFYLEKNMNAVFFENLKSFAHYSKKSNTVIQKLILDGFSNGKITIKPNWTGNTYSMKNVELSLKGGEKIELYPSKDYKNI